MWTFNFPLKHATWRNFCLGLLFLTPFTSTAQFIPPPSTALSNQIQAVLDQSVTNGGAYGGILTVCFPGQWYWLGGTGNASISPLTTAQPYFSFRAASLSKSFVAASLLKLQEQQLIDLDDPITLYLPSNVTANISQASQISVRMLLNHRSGIKEFSTSLAYIQTVIINGLGQAFTPTQLITYATNQGAAFPPGSGFFYSNTNYVLAALVIESITSQSYVNFIQSNFLQPLNLSGTFVPASDSLLVPHMKNYADLDGNSIPEDYSVINPSSTFGSGFLVTNMGDMITWREALQKGMVLSAASKAEMDSFLQTGINSPEYGLGLQKWSVGPLTLEGHTGNLFNSSDLEYCPELNLYYVFNVTNLEFNPDDLRIPLLQLIGPIADSCNRFTVDLVAPDTVYLNAGTQYQIQAPADPSYQYAWSLNGQNLPGAMASSYGASSAGSYQVSITNSLSCTKKSKTVVLLRCTADPLGIRTQTGDSVFCTGSLVSLSLPPGAGGSWYNATNDTLATGISGISFILDQSKTIFVLGKDPNGCIRQDAIALTAAPYPVVDLGSDGLVATGGSANFTAGMPGDSVRWFSSGAGFLATGNAFAWFPIDGGNSQDTLWAVVTSSFGCEARDTVTFLISVGNERLTFPGLKIYPNPAHDLLTVQADENLQAEAWTLIDVAGRTVATGLTEGTGSLTFDVSNLPDGLYLLKSKAGFAGHRVMIRH